MFPLRLLELRKSQHLTQKALADELGVSQQTVAQWEKGTREPNIDMLIEIADLFEISLDNLLRTEQSEFSKELDAIEKIDKCEIRRFLNKLYEDTASQKITWYRFSDRHSLPTDSGCINYDLSYLADLGGAGAEISLFYCSEEPGRFTIMPEIKSPDGFNTTLPPDPGTQRTLKKIYKYVERELPNHKAQGLSSFIQKYLDA